MESLLRDLRIAVRLLGRDRAFTLTVLLTLSLCVGANVAVFSVVRAVILRPLPFEDPERLVTLYNSYPGTGFERGANSVVDFFLRREHVDSLEDVALYDQRGSTVGEAGSTERVPVLQATPSLFPMLRVGPALGRSFTEDEMEPGQSDRVLLTHGYWQEQLGGRPDAVGRTLRMDGVLFDIVGILPEGFRMPGHREIRLVVPLAFTPEERSLENWHSNSFEMLGRLRPGAGIEQASAQVAAANDAITDEVPLPNIRQVLADVGFHTVVVPTQDDLVRTVRPTLYLLWAGVGFILLIGCANVANLALARAHGRAGELATRLALGAPKAKLVRQLLTESLVMGLLSALGGGLIAAVGIGVFADAGFDGLLRGSDVRADASVVAVALLLGVGTALLSGLIPVARLLRGELHQSLGQVGRTASPGRNTTLIQNGLVVSQLALVFPLLAGAGLMLLSLQRALGVDPGFEVDSVWTGAISLPGARYGTPEEQRRFSDELLGGMTSLPGVADAGITSMLPFSGNASASVIIPEGYAPSPGESLLAPYQSTVGPGYFDSMGIELIEGRGFEVSDDADNINVIIIDEWLARRYWPDSSPLGARMAYGVTSQEGVPEENLFTVVGVVGTVRQNDLTDLEHPGAYYFTYRQRPIPNFTITARSDLEPEALTAGIRRLVAGLDPEIPLFDVRTLRSRVDGSLTVRRTTMILLQVSAGLALVLAAVGITGVLSRNVAERRKELGIRMAAGSSPARVFGMVLRRGALLGGAGLLLGGVFALLLGNLIQSLLFEVDPLNPAVLLATGAALELVVLLACAAPAGRASRLDPVQVLS